MAGVDPWTLRAPRVDDNADAAQAFVVALDLIVRLGDQGQDGAQLTWNGIFDALARHWSVSYREAQRRDAVVTYSMAPRTICAAWREMRWAGFDVEAIWTLLVRPTGALTKLYTLRRKSGKGHALGRKVQLVEGQLLDDVRCAILSDGQYVRPDHRRLLLADDHAPPLPPRQEVYEEQPYETVTLGERSRRVLSLLESARVQFYVGRFRQDFEARPELAAWRPIYEQTSGIVPEVVDIRSRFFRAVNRRFHAADFWPEHVPGNLRPRWFGATPYPVEGFIDLDSRDQYGEPELARFEDEVPNTLVERDIASSQTQVLAVFLDLPDLEELACDPMQKFKVWLAQQLWALHERDAVLAPGYNGPDDERLVAFIKELWMRRNYGGKFGETVRDLAKDKHKATYGPGWSADVFKTGGVDHAGRLWDRFLASLPEWERAISQFLKVCQSIGREADWEYGITLDDPLDGSEIQWNPIRRAIARVATGKHHVEVLRPGVTWRRRDVEGRMIRRFSWRDPYVNTAKLANRVAPCLVHSMDAYFNALVLEDLHGRGVTQIVAVHDGWFVPETIVMGRGEEGEPMLGPGAQLLEHAIEHVGREWLEGIGGVYGWLADATLGTPHRRFAREIRQRWRRRIAEQRWPQFTAT